ncbi:MAG TPA: hypothetical protein VI299_20655, partial [Polyangiales bacterium]
MKVLAAGLSAAFLLVAPACSPEEEDAPVDSPDGFVSSPPDGGARRDGGAAQRPDATTPTGKDSSVHDAEAPSEVDAASDAQGPRDGAVDAGGDAAGGGGSVGGGGALPLKNPPALSTGCGKATALTTGKKTIMSGGQNRTYIIDIPSGYDASKPYRLFYTSHWIGSTSEAVRDQNYYFLKPLAQAAKEPAIFVAPQADGSTWQQKDHALFDD